MDFVRRLTIIMFQHLKKLPKTGKKLSELLFTRSKETSNKSGHQGIIKLIQQNQQAITFKMQLNANKNYKW